MILLIGLRGLTGPGRVGAGIAPGLDRHVRRVRMELLDLIDAGEDTVVVAERYGGRAKLSGVETASMLWAVLNIRDGRIARGREYMSREPALEAVGLRE